MCHDLRPGDRPYGGISGVGPAPPSPGLGPGLLWPQPTPLAAGPCGRWLAVSLVIIAVRGKAGKLTHTACLCGGSRPAGWAHTTCGLGGTAWSVLWSPGAAVRPTGHCSVREQEASPGEVREWGSADVLACWSVGWELFLGSNAGWAMTPQPSPYELARGWALWRATPRPTLPWHSGCVGQGWL